MLFWKHRGGVGFREPPPGGGCVTCLANPGGRKRKRQPDIGNDPWPPGPWTGDLVSAAGNAPWPIKGNCLASSVGGARRSYSLRYSLHFFQAQKHVKSAEDMNS